MDSTIEKIVSWFIKKQLDIFYIENIKDRAFVCSDFPIYFEGERSGIAYPESQWNFPLTKDIFLIIRPHPNSGKINYIPHSFTPKEIRNINYNISKQASRYILWHDKKLVEKYGEAWKNRKDHSFIESTFL